MSERVSPTTRIPRIALVGAEGAVGTSTVQLGLLVALKAAGIEVAGGKIGPDLIAPALHRRVCNRLAHTFDAWLVSRNSLSAALAQAASGNELLLLEGEGGLFDLFRSRGQPIKQTQLAEYLSMPVVVVVDGNSYQKNISALLEAYSRSGVRQPIAGIIVNKMPPAAQEARIARAVRALDGPRYLGSLPYQPAAEFVGRPSTVTDNIPTVTTRNQLIRLGDFVSSHLDLNEFRALASEAPLLDLQEHVYASASPRCRIAVADDQAFHLTVQNNLELLRRAGAQLVFFSPLADNHLPADVGAVYLPGGYLEQYIDLIHANPWIIKSLQKFVAGGGLLYAEGEAAVYLCREATFANGKQATLCGLLPGIAKQVRSAGEGRYAAAAVQEDNILGTAGQSMRGIDRLGWNIQLDHVVPSTLRLREIPVSIYEGEPEHDAVREDGFMPLPNVLVSTAHLHFGSLPSIVKRIVDAITN